MIIRIVVVSLCYHTATYRRPSPYPVIKYHPKDKKVEKRFSNKLLCCFSHQLQKKETFARSDDTVPLLPRPYNIPRIERV